MTKYVVSAVYQEYGGRATSDIIGTFSTYKNAMVALDNHFHRMCDRLGVEELNALSYQDEDSFKLQEENDLWYATGIIDTCEEDEEYLPEDFEADYGDNNVANPKPQQEKVKPHYERVKSLKELLDKIQKHVDEGIEPVEVMMLLNYGANTHYSITFADEIDEAGDYKLEIHSHVDDTTEIMTQQDLFNDWKTYIGKAINCGALYYVLD